MQTLSKAPYTPPTVVTYSVDSWQARLVAKCQGLHSSNKPFIISVVVGNGAVRWFVGSPDGMGKPDS